MRTWDLKEYGCLIKNYQVWLCLGHLVIKLLTQLVYHQYQIPQSLSWTLRIVL